jgi:hypothetical protein
MKVKKNYLLLQILIVLALLLASACTKSNVSESASSENPKDQTTSSSNSNSANGVGDPLNSTYIIDNKEIHLKDGTAEVEAAPGSATKEKTKIWETPASGDLNADQVNDYAVILMNEPGGSGTFYYVSALVGQTATNAVLLGDRIKPKSLEIKNGKIHVNYLDRKLEDAMSEEPTIEVTKIFTVKDGKLVD